MGFLQHIVRAQIGCHGRAAMAAATGRRWLIQQQRLLATGTHDDLIPQQRWTTTSRSCGTTTTTKRPLIESVIFDFDGVIIDSETIFYRINSETLAHFGVQYTLGLKQGQMGRKLTEGVDYVLKRTGLAERGVSQQQYLTIYGKLVDQLLPNCQLMPGARRLVEHLHKSSVQMAICTGSASDEFAKKVDNCHDLVATMNTVVLAGDDPEVRLGKPAPDAYLVTMGRMRPQPRDPGRVLVFEDSVHGVDSALSAGCQVIWVPQKQFLLDDLDTMVRHFRRHPSFAEALESLEQFRPEKYGLPAFSS